MRLFLTPAWHVIAMFTVTCAFHTPLGGAPADKSTMETAKNCDVERIDTYTNPVNVPIADPFVLREGDTYYMYGTGTSPHRGFKVYTSPDLVRWTLAGRAYAPDKDSWGHSSFWAPEVIKKDGAFYLHFTTYNRDEGRRNICIARSESPLGPFQDYAGPLYPDRSVIDSHIYHDETSGKYYIYASPEDEPPSRILGAELSADMTQLATTPTVCLLSEYGWEDLWIEGPIIEKHDDTLYMIYSGGAFWESDYALGYATATSPLGPWVKSPTNPILKKHGTEVEGPGHNGLARSPDGSELFVVYHRHASPATISRVVALDRLIFEESTTGPDTLRAPGAPSFTPQPLPSGAAALQAPRSDDFSSGSLDTDLWEIYENNPGEWSIKDGRLIIRAGDDDLWRNRTGGENIFLQRMPPRTCDFAIETSVTMEANRLNEQAFLILWYDADNYVMLSASWQGEARFVGSVEVNGKADASLAPNPFGMPVCLRMEKRGNTVKLLASKDGKDWIPAGPDLDISRIDVRYVGLGAWSPGTNRKLPARFDYFKFLSDPGR